MRRIDTMGVVDGNGITMWKPRVQTEEEKASFAAKLNLPVPLPKKKKSGV